MIIPETRDPMDAAMFDIDDTLIDSRTGEIIPDVYRIYKDVQNKGYKMIIITARPGHPDNVAWTRNQLKDSNITYNELIFTPPLNKATYKRESRYKFILSVGDMDTDLTDSKYSIKVSNVYHTRGM
jgi:predicted HAD superfamily phosphohydrolase YqeG